MSNFYHLCVLEWPENQDVRDLRKTSENGLMDVRKVVSEIYIYNTKKVLFPPRKVFFPLKARIFFRQKKIFSAQKKYFFRQKKIFFRRFKFKPKKFTQNAYTSKREAQFKHFL